MSLLAARAAATPTRTAFATHDASVTYRELWNDSVAIAGGLYDLGVRRGDRVAFLIEAGLDFVRLFWAVQRLGAISVAFNPFVPEETALRRAERVRPKLIVRDVASIPRRELSDEVDVSADDFAFFQPTSGTSGESRAAMIRHRNIVAVLAASEEALGINASDILVSWVPPWHDLGLVRFVIGTVYAGATCHIVRPAIQTIPEWLSVVSEVRGTITGAPDFAIRLASKLVDPSKVELSSLRSITNGGEPVRLSTINAFESRFHIPGRVLPGYGLAEATLGVSATRPGERVRVDARGNVSCGIALPNVELTVAADGELLVRGPGVFAGYFEAPESTAETLRDGWLHTGDVGSLDDDGHCYVLGRKRAMLKRAGASIAPRELEEAAHEVEGVKLAAAVTLPGRTTEDIVVVVEAESDVAAAVSQAVKRALGFAPQRVLVVAPRTIPRTYNGKVRHDALREMLQAAAVANER